MFDGSNWNVPDFALRQAREARRKRRLAAIQAGKPNANTKIHLKRIGAELMPLERSLTGWSAAADEPWSCLLILNDLNVRGATVYVTHSMVVGTHVGFSLDGFGSFHARGRIVSCTPLPVTGKILSERGSLRYSVRISFEYESEAEIYSIHGFTNAVREQILGEV